MKNTAFLISRHEIDLKSLFFLFLFSAVSVGAQENSREGTPEQVYERYKQAFISQDLAAIPELYAADAIVVTPDGNIHRGLDSIRKTYERAFNYLPSSLRFETLYKVAEEKLLTHTYVMWDEETGENLIPFSTETFLIEDGKIRYHTIAEYYPERHVKAPYPLSAPDAWNTQTSSLPRYFAPNLYEGIADYAFAPGMFDPGDEGYFTYAMVLWLPMDTDVSRQQLEKDLETYFDGLAVVGDPELSEVNAEQKTTEFFDSLATRYSMPAERLKADIELTPVAGEDRWENSYNGKMRIFEGLAANEPLELNTEVMLQKCVASDHRVIFMKVSPQPYSHELWSRLDAIAKQWQCPKPQ